MTSAPTDLDGTPRSPYASSAAPGSPRAAWALAIGCWILAAAALVLFFSSYAPGSTFAEDWPFVFTDATMAGVYGTVAAVVLARRRHVVAVFLIVAAVGGGLAAFGAGWRQAVLVGRLPAAPAIEVLYGSAWVPGTLSLFLVVPWLVRERVTPRAWLGAAAGLVVVVAFIMLPALVPDTGTAVAGLTAVAIAGGLATAAGVEHRRRGSGPGEREGLGWLAFGTAMMALSFLPLLLPYGVLPMWIVPALHLACQSVFPAAILVVVLRQRLWGLELAVSRATVAATLAVLLLGLYLAVTALVGRLIGGTGGAQLVAAAAVVVALQPARLRLQRRIHTMVYGQAHDPRAVAGRMGTALGRSGDAEELLGSLVSTLGSTLRLESAQLRIDERTVTSWGRPTGPAEVLALVHGGEPVGELLLTAPPGERLDQRSRRALEELTAVMVAGVALVRSTWALETSRERLTRARLHERQVLRRELHDGLVPWLAGLRLGLQGVRNTVRTSPDTAAEMLALLQQELDQRIDDVRTASRQLLPPVLEELGLEAALVELATRHRETGLEVELRCRGVGPDLAPAVSAAAYGIASEAVTNVARHAGVDRCILEVDAGGPWVEVRCRDAGVGLAAGRTPGVGTRAMRERAEEQGGTLELRALEPRGTEVVARLPLRSRDGAVIR